MIEPRTIIAGDRHTRNGLLICVVSLFVLATALRILNITNPPLDYFPLRQLRAAIIARGMYYQQLPSANPATIAKSHQAFILLGTPLVYS